MEKILSVKIAKEILKNAITNIKINQEYINSLNVFPVPDGDTGSNVYATMNEAYKNIAEKEFTYSYEVFNAFAKQMLYSARGNSGVIHSQVFSGLAKGLDQVEAITPLDFIHALKSSKEATYNSVLNPQEGTILTIIRIVCENSANYRFDNFENLFVDIVNSATEALALTPTLLPVLAEVGVVDSGATALCMILQGMKAQLLGETLVTKNPVDNVTKMANGSGFSTEEIKYMYCNEFLIILDKEFDKAHYINELSKIGDSIVAIELDGTVKSHVHSNEPNKVLELGLSFGMLNKIKIDNMHFEHQETIQDFEEVIEKTPRAIIAVANSLEMEQLFKKMGVHYVINGGQSKNPSTKDFVDAINAMQAQEVIIFPNNSNIFMSAEQVCDLVDARVEVIKTRSVVQAYSSLLIANKEADFDDLVEELNEAVEDNSYGEITRSVRDTNLNDVEIKKNDFLGIYNKEICISSTNFKQVLKTLLDQALEDDKEIITIIKGKDLNKKLNSELESLMNYYEEEFDLEFDVIVGNQELYPIILGAD